MAGKDGTTSGSLTGDPDEGKGLVPDKDEEPCDPDSGDEKDALIPDRHDPSLGAARNTSGEESVGSPYACVPSQQAGWGAKATGQCASTWLMQPIDQNIYSEWDPVAQSEWSRAQVRAGAWAPERGAVAWWRERDEMRQEIHFLRCNMELLLAHAEAAEQDRQDPLQLLPPQPPEGEQLVPALPNDKPPGQLGPLGLPGPQQPQAPQRQRRVKAHFDRTMEKLPYFLVQFEDPFEEEKAWVRLRQIRQGSQSVSEYVSEFRQLAGVVQDWPEQRDFREGLHPEVAQWAMVTAELTSLAGWYTWAGKAEIRLWRVQLLKQRDNPLPASPHPLLEGTCPARSGKEAKQLLYAQRRRWLGLCLSCGGEGHKAAVGPSKKSDSPVGPTGGAATTRTTLGPGKKSPFKKGAGLQVALREASSTPEEVGGPKSSKELAGKDSDLA
uniref:Uncharacterized protein n=1 Tax=Sphaerodactylus townsendi TaxID=933632 RepID=A0ACB8FER7_9SAUR